MRIRTVGGVFGAAPVLAVALVLSSQAFAVPLYSQGFETNSTTGWPGAPTRVASGTNGITSADGSFHAEVAPTASVPFTYTELGRLQYIERWSRCICSLHDIN